MIAGVCTWRHDIAILLLFCCSTGSFNALAQVPPETVTTEKQSAVGVADRILINGKILTVDANFSITEAIAIQGERILAVGTTGEIQALAGPATMVTDLQGRTVMPGLIDNHHHFVRATEQWYRQVRWDEVTSRQSALQLLQARARSLPPGSWIVVLGGWIFEQFRDDSKPFTMAELDAVLPDNPLYIQLGYGRGYANTLALRAVGIDANTKLAESGTIVKDDNGKLTGELIGAGAFLRVAGKIPPTPDAVWDNSVQLTIDDYLQAGLTALLDVGGNTVTPAHYATLNRAAASGKLSMRIFYTLNNTNGVGPGANDIISSLSTVSPSRGDDHFGQFAYGEMTYAGIRDGVGPDWHLAEAPLNDYHRIAETAAEHGWQLHEHSTRDDKIAAVLSIFESVNKQHLLRDRRWTLAHCENISAASIERAVNLGILFALHSSAGQGAPAMARQSGRAAVSRVPPIRTIQQMGGIWGLGSDGTVVAGYNPFHNLGWAVTGKARSGEKLLDETVSREDALIAHTRSNAYLLFKETVLGSLEPGKYADLLVLDRHFQHQTGSDHGRRRSRL
ncbi:MAG: Amidohydro 3 protein [Gammaproteobacteria bacterium]|nr:Amidohydro 3 protein [Gammaproteobacteria bacterium]